MSSLAQKELADLADALDRRLAVQLCVYDYTGTMGAILPPHLSMHRHPFCRAVLGQHHDLCRDFDYFTALRDVVAKRIRERNTGCFLKRCHASVSEVVCPIMRNHALAGVAILGPMRLEAAEQEIKPALSSWRRVSLMPDQVELRQGLPLLDELLFADLCGLLVSIAARIEQLSIQYLPISQAEMDRRWRVESLVARRFMFELSLADVAQELSISESRARRVFIELFGEPFSQYLRNVRLAHAERLLTGTDLSVSQIAEASGFNQSAYFHNVFRRHRGVTPLAYRKSRQADSAPSGRGGWGAPGLPAQETAGEQRINGQANESPAEKGLFTSEITVSAINQK